MNNDTVAHVAGSLLAGNGDWKNVSTRDAIVAAAVDTARNVVFQTERRAWPTTGAQPTGIADRIRSLPVAVRTDGSRVVSHADLIRILEESNV